MSSLRNAARIEFYNIWVFRGIQLENVIEYLDRLIVLLLLGGRDLAQESLLTDEGEKPQIYT